MIPDYRKDLKDAADDPYHVRTAADSVFVGGERIVADLWLTPPQALKLARRLTKAAAVAYEQERELAPR